MKSSCMLRLPYRAQEIVPPDVAAMLPTGALAIGVRAKAITATETAETGWSGEQSQAAWFVVLISFG